MIPRMVSVRVVQVRRSPTRSSKGSRYAVKGSFHASSHFMGTPPAMPKAVALILPQLSKEDYEWMSSAAGRDAQAGRRACLHAPHALRVEVAPRVDQKKAAW